MRKNIVLFLVVVCLSVWASYVRVFAAKPASGVARSPATEECIGCHLAVSPGIVGEWEKSVHAHTSPREARKKTGLENNATRRKSTSMRKT